MWAGNELNCLSQGLDKLDRWMIVFKENPFQADMAEIITCIAVLVIFMVKIDSFVKSSPRLPVPEKGGDVGGPGEPDLL